jgi:hypothetical protein
MIDNTLQHGVVIKIFAVLSVCKFSATSKVV